jgi:serine/threonine protein kinase/tetratricopeptide (TPR) repeat protein
VNLAPGTCVGRYRILSALGAGGMGEVYRARDTRLGRDVAVKVLHASFAGDAVRVRRFEVEARAASALSHPNILAVYDVGTNEGASYLVTELLEGETLAAHLKGRPLPVARALDLAIQMALGLAAAHAKAIVHRDFKPENVFITSDGRVKILDFGLARPLLPIGPVADRTEAATYEGAAGTEAGVVLGTVGYMSPEQAKGRPADPRSDVFGLGCVIYEMLSGRRAFARASAIETLGAILAERPPDLAGLASVPREVAAVVDRCLEKDPGARFASAIEVVAALQHLPPRPAGEDEDAAPAAKSLLVLPFTDLSPGKDNEYFSDGLTEEIIGALSRIRSLRVISRTTAMSLKQTPKSVPALGRELGVRHVLEGSVRRAGNNLRISAHLVDAGSDAPVWSDRFAGTLDDVFEIQERVSRAIAEALEVRLTSSEDRRMAKRPISSIQVYDCYLRARAALQTFSASGLQEAERLLSEGLAVAGENALLLAGLARVHFEHVDLGMQGEEGLEEAETFARRALALDPDCAPASAVLGLVMHFRGDLREAVRLLRRAVELDPHDTDTLWWLAWFHLWLIGRPREGMTIARRSVELDPANLMGYSAIAFAHFVEGRYEEAAAAGEVIPHEHPMYRYGAGLVLAGMGRTDEALALLDPVEPTESFEVGHYFALFLKLALRGERGRFAEALRPEFVRLAEIDACTAAIFTMFYALAGDSDTALDWLEKAVSRGYFNYPFLHADNRFTAPLHGHPRFERLMTTMKAKWEAFGAQDGPN